ncbi:MAG: NADH-quinone oxidoreductase subunit NuoG [Gammaproteobacteria bacterium]
MSDDLITIEVDGKAVEARKGSMLIEATDAAGIYIPRFCYHKHLSVAANCRMCLVEVEKAPKPLPACATPVMDGMKVFTKSERAVDAQKSTMEFLLINHPLDCPICDQGGECELQDLAMGYGGDVSRYTEAKRVVRDKDIGPLVQTDMTRCIHCTRCVRFGEEIAGLRELGATGRGEHMEIGTYVEKAMNSELSGNVIDLCPVGALTSKPYRYSARAWELRQHDGISPHDCVGSNLHFHVKGQVVKRIVPKDNPAVNETWIADRDRFSYEALQHESRLLSPRIKDNGSWRDCDWDTAFAAAKQALEANPADVAALSSPSATTEEQFLLQKLVRELGGSNVDHRLRQQDFSCDEAAPSFPSLRMTMDELENVDAVLLVGSNPRQEQPLLNHRLRKAALKGAKIISVNCVDYDFNYTVAETLVVKPGDLAPTAAAILKALGKPDGETLTALVKDCETVEQHNSIAEILRNSSKTLVLSGNSAQRNSRYGPITLICDAIASSVDGVYGQLTDGANAAGAWLAGAVPHRGPAGRKTMTPGENTTEMVISNSTSVVLLAVEPDQDCAGSAKLRKALSNAAAVISLNPFTNPSIDELATVQLPIATFAENEGSYVNCTGEWQRFAAAVKAPGEARTAWKVLRVLGEQLGLNGFDAINCADVTNEIQALCSDSSARSPANPRLDLQPLSASANDLECFPEVFIYQVDALTRRASALQASQRAVAEQIAMNAATAQRLNLAAGDTTRLSVDGKSLDVDVTIRVDVPDNVFMCGAAAALGATVELVAG